MGDVADHAVSNKKRDYPAWGYLLVGGLVAGISAWLIAIGALDDSRRPYLPWLMLGLGGWAIALGVREWSRNGSLTARRTKSAEERRRDAQSARRLMKWQVARFVVAAVVLLVVVIVALFR